MSDKPVLRAHDATLLIGSARIHWAYVHIPGLRGDHRKLVIDAPKANPRSQKHAQIMLSELQIEHLKKWLADEG